MLTWEEIRELQNEPARRFEYKHEYCVRKTYEKMLPMVENLFSAFWLYLKCYLTEKKSVNKCWKCFVEDNKNTVIAEWIGQMGSAICSDELKEHFNELTKTYIKEREK